MPLVLLTIILQFAFLQKITAQQKKILFIGNSFTYYPSFDAATPEMPINLNGIAQGMNPVDALSYTLGDHAIQGGQTLEGHYNSGIALNKIAQGGWKFVVLQEQSLRPYDDTARYFKYVRLFDAAIKAAGAKTVIYMTWAYKNDWYKFPTYVRNFELIAREINAIVVPCGKAWEKAIANNTNFNLYNSDNVHPSTEGTYLNACVFFATLSGRNPEGTSFAPVNYPISSQSDIQYARTNAWQTVQSYIQPGTANVNNLLINPGFEEGILGWTYWGTPTINTGNQKTGNKCNLVGTSWDGDCQKITASFSVGDNFTYSAWFKYAGSGYGGGNILYQFFNGNNEIDYGYTDVPSSIGTNYTKFTKTFTVPPNTTDIMVSFGNNSNQLMYVDDAVLVKNPPTNLLVNPGFEEGINAWTMWGTPTINTTNQRTGNNCNLISTNWDGDCQAINTGFSIGDNFTFSAWFKYAGANNGGAGGQLNYQCYNGDTEIDFGTTEIPSTIGNTYTLFTKTFTVPLNTTQIRVSFGNSSNQVLYVDDAALINNSSGKLFARKSNLPPLKNEINVPVKITVSPNPFTDYVGLTILSNVEDDFTIIVYDVTGKIVFTKKLRAKNETIRLNKFPVKAAYILKVINSKNITVTEKIIQQ